MYLLTLASPSTFPLKAKLHESTVCFHLSAEECSLVGLHHSLYNQHHLKGVWIVFSVWLLWIMLQ